MTASTRIAFILFLLTSLFLGGAAVSSGQWPTDPMQNLAIATRAGDQTVPKIASSPDRGTYVAWFDPASGNYDVYLQRLDAAGNEQWPHNGILVSNHQQSSSLVDWDLISDSAGNAVVVFTDIRAGGDLDVFAYKVSPQGAMLWGPDGLAISDNADFDPSPKVCEASDGDLVFVWSRMPDVGDATIMMQRVSPDGVERFAHGGIVAVSVAGEDPAFAQVVPSLDGSVIVLWVRNIRQFTSPRHLRADRFSAAGAPMWATPAIVFDAVSLPIAYWPVIQPDGSGGALVCWHRSQSNLYNSLVQHLNANGAEVFPHNGVLISTNTTRFHMDPTMSYHPETGEIFVFFEERTTNQDRWGVSEQKLSAAGARQWGEEGIVLLPMDAEYKFFERSAPCPGGAMVFLCDEPIYGQDRIIGMRVDGAGNKVWPGAYIEVSTYPSSKGRLPITQDTAGAVKLIWEDNRNGNNDIYGQNVNTDGTLGPAPAGVSPLSLAGGWIANQPNPFSGATEIRYALPRASADARIVICDASGRAVRSLVPGLQTPGEHSASWDATDDQGRPVPAGVYYYRLSASGLEVGQGRAVVVR
jgi:hypothetical protein